jgi:hypothetical protein
MANFAEALNRLANGSARPEWTLVAIASLMAGGITVSVQFAFG